jgi:hypothetical protein
MTINRRRFKQIVPLQDRLSAWATTVRLQANRLPPGPERDALRRRAEQADAALDQWDNSIGLGDRLSHLQGG